MNSTKINLTKVLVTGANGFVGKNLFAYLKAYGYEALEALNLRSDWFQQINNTNLDQGVIIHLAGKAHDLKKTSASEAYYEVNFELTKKLYDAFLASNAKQFIFISSVKAAADTVVGELKEDVTPNPQTHYGKSKLMAEQYILSQTLPEGKSYYIIRPCMIHGPGNKGNLNLLYQFVKKGIPYPLAAFANRRSYLSVENLCFILNELIMGSVPSGIYHVADDEPLSTAHVFSLLAQASHKKARLWHIPKSLIKLMATIGDKIKLPLNSERLEKLTDNYIVSNKKIKSALNKPLPLTATEGLLKTAHSFNQNLQN